MRHRIEAAHLDHLIRHCEPTGRANARPMTGSAKQSMLPRSKSGLLRRFRLRSLSYGGQVAPRNDVGNFMTPRSRGAMGPSFAKIVSPLFRIEGVGNAGCPMHPQPRVQNK